MIRLRRYRDYDATDLVGRAGPSGTVETGLFTHHILFGLDAYDYELDTVQNRWRTVSSNGDTTYLINLYKPVYGQEAPTSATLLNNTEKPKIIMNKWGHTNARR